jgi:hypothetical protein
MIPTEEGLEEEGERLQQRLFGAEPPVEGYFQISRMLVECPGAASEEVPCRLDRKTIWTPGFNNASDPAQTVWQLAARQQPMTLAESVLAGRCKGFHAEIDLRPPAEIAWNIG